MRVLFLLFLLLTTRPVWAVNVQPQLDLPANTTDAGTASLNALVSAIGSATKTLIISQPLPAITGNLTVPSALTLAFSGAGQIACGSSTLTIQSSTSNWPSRQIFASDCSSTGSVSFSGNLAALTYDPVWWGAAGDLIADDTLELQAAINAACSAGGGTVLATQDYLANAVSSVPTLGNFVLTIGCDNLTIEGRGKGRIKTSNSSFGRLLTAWGIFKPGGRSGSQDFQYADATVYTMTTATRGAQSITLATPSHANNFVVNDYIFIRTGQCVTGSGAEPDSELNQVVSSNGETGIIVLRYPLAKNYAQEYYISGTSGITSTSVTANLAPFGAAKVTDRTIKNIRIANVSIEVSSGQSDNVTALAGGQIDGVVVENVTGNVTGPFHSYGQFRAGRFTRNVVYIKRSDDTFWYCFSTATGATDVIIADNVCTGHGFMHSHEGGARIVYANNIVNQDVNTVSADNAYSFRARGYDIHIHGGSIYHNMPGAAVRIESDVLDGSVTGLVINGAQTTTGIGLLSTSGKWAMTGNVCLNGLTGCGIVLPDGTLGSNLAVAFAAALNTGMDRYTTGGRLVFNVAGVAGFGSGGNGILFGNAGALQWTDGNINSGTITNSISKGSGSPESVVTAKVGSMYLRTDGGVGTSLYIKESGTGNTGWVAK